MHPRSTVWVTDKLEIMDAEGQKHAFRNETVATLDPEGMLQVILFQAVLYKKPNKRLVSSIVKELSSPDPTAPFKVTTCAGWLLRAQIRDATCDEITATKDAKFTHLPKLKIPEKSDVAKK